MAVRNRGARSGHCFLSIVASIAVVCFVRLLCLRPNELPPVNLSVHGNDVASSKSFCMDTGACFWLSFSLYCSSGWLLEQALAAGLRGIRSQLQPRADVEVGVGCLLVKIPRA
jgi:hypothetical protein